MIAFREARPEDCNTLAALKLATFRQTFVEEFGIPYPPDDLAAFEAESYGAEAVARSLVDLERATWVAERDERLLAYAHVGPCKLPHPDVAAGAGEIYQLYVHRDAQGLGLGRRLLDMSLAHLDRHFPGPAWLGVWSGNLRAQAVYAGRGFAKVGEYRFPVGAWFDDEFILRRG